mgnify:FL=1
MKTPLRKLNNRAGSFSKVVKHLADEPTTIHFPFFVNGGLELSLCAVENKIVGHTNHWCVYDFWQCLKDDPRRLADNIQFIVGYEHFEERFYYHMQEHFQENVDVFVRSAQFYALNMCNESGQIYSGKFIGTKYINEMSLFNMKNLELHNLQLNMHETEKPIDIIDKINSDEQIIITPPKFSYRLLPGAQVDTLAAPNIDHTRLHEKLQEKNKWIMVCNYHNRLSDIYNNFHIEYYDQNWRPTNKSTAKEMLIVKS